MAVEVLMPKLGLTMTEGTVDGWLVQEGAEVKKGDPICTISSEKLTYDVEAPEDGILIKIVATEGTEVPCIEPIGYVGARGETVGENPTEESQAETKEAESAVLKISEETTQTPSQPPVREEGERIFATPLARKIAKEKNYDLADVNGSGGNGRITRRDVESYKPISTETPSTSTPVIEVGKGLKGMRKTIAQRMHHSIASTAQLSFHRKADITELMIFRKTIKNSVISEMKGNPLGITSLLTRAVVLALQDHPDVNAWYDGNELILHESIHIGMAVSLDEGLIVPVIKEANRMTLTQISQAIEHVAKGARQGELTSDELSGSTFTITNLGNAKIEYFTPVLNTPEVGILGVGGLMKELALNEEGEVVEKVKLPLSLTTDHQVLDGVPSAEFFNSVISYLENPYLLML